MKPNLFELFLSFLKLGFTAFGGPAMVFYIRRVAVDSKKWIDNSVFQEGVALAQTVPGATAMQVAAYVGFLTRGIIGGVVCYTAFALPAFLIMLLLSLLYSKTHKIATVVSVFSFLQVIVISIVAFAAWNFTKPILKHFREIALSIMVFMLLLLKVNPFYIIVACILLSQIIFKDSSSARDGLTLDKRGFTGLSVVFVVFILLLTALYFIDKTLFTLAITMVKIDLFAFGGAYAAIPLMFHEFVERLGWIQERTLLDGIALGQLTPGPIVITSTFIGYLTQGISGAVVATIFTFSPSFLLIALATKLSYKFTSSRFFVKAKKGLLASFSGLMLYVTVKFSLSLEWSIINLATFLVSFFGLLKGLGVPVVVVFGVLLSLIVSSLT